MALGRSLIVSMGGEEFIVKRSSGGSYVNGVYTGPPLAGVTITASKQPLGRDVENLAEGDRTKNSVKLYSADELKIHNEKTGAAADVIIIDGSDFEIKYVEAWPNYWKAIAVEVESSDNFGTGWNGVSDIDGGDSDDTVITYIDGGNAAATGTDVLSGGNAAGE
jgi:hypothetical protein